MLKKHLIFKKILLCIIFTGILGVLTILGINCHVKSSAKDFIAISVPENTEYDCILVFGCGVSPDGTPSSMLSDRLKKAVELYKAKAAPKIIMSGDHGTKSYDEVNAMRKYAIDCGVPEEDIFMDHAGFSTYESIYRAKSIFCADSIIAVTQKYHLYRAVYIAQRFGLNVTGVASDYRSYAGQIYRDIREIPARCKDFFTCIFKPKPTFLGEAIPVSGSGIQTHD